MIRPDDRTKITITLNNYARQKANYHFYNWELAELLRCERDIKSVISTYEDDITDLAQLISEFPAITEFVSREKLEEIKNKFSPKVEEVEENVFYSLDGRKHPTLEEAQAANEHLTSTMQPKTR